MNSLYRIGRKASSPISVISVLPGDFLHHLIWTADRWFLSTCPPSQLGVGFVFVTREGINL